MFIGERQNIPSTPRDNDRVGKIVAKNTAFLLIGCCFNPALAITGFVVRTSIDMAKLSIEEDHQDNKE
ncbi:MAG: hypothetical protein AAFR81_14210 [Chloroflexota bacterium]